MLQINGKTFMNLQEAVQWLLDNNALPFQSSANYIANTEIGMGTIVNPSPARVRIGSLIFFADSKVSTVTGLTENGFICSDEYNNLVDDIAYVTNVAINASGHLITTLSDGQTIDAGIVKQVSNFSINGSQHLIVSFNDGTSTDLGAIFNGNVNIAGNFTADSIIENMSGYSYTSVSTAGWTVVPVYIGAVKTGNKLTLVNACKVTKTAVDAINLVSLGGVVVPNSVANKIFPFQDTTLDVTRIIAVDSSYVEKDVSAFTDKLGTNYISFGINATNLELNKTYYVRIEETFLLNDSLAS